MPLTQTNAAVPYAGAGSPLQPTFLPVTSPAVVTAISGQLVSGYWKSVGEMPAHFNVKPGGTLNVDLSALTAGGQALAKLALDAWTQSTGILFNTEPAAGAAIHLSFDDDQSGAYTIHDKVGAVINSAHVNIGLDWLASYGEGAASYSLQSYIHEIGHALGLGHAGNYNGSASFPRDALFAQDSWQMSIMSYFSQSQNRSSGASFAWTISPMLADMKAMETIYGTNAKVGYGNTTYGIGSNAGALHQAIGQMMAGGTLANPISFTVMDRNGIDTLDFSTDVANQVINLTPGAASSIYGLTGNLLIEGTTIIEILRGGHANDALRGNTAANQIFGGEGNDSIEGAEGSDSLEGGTGNDALLGGLLNDTLNGGDGLDWLSGDDGDDKLFGGGGTDKLIGGAGKDVLDGGVDTDWLDGGDGADSLVGGDGVDTLLGGLGNDTLYGGDGIDSLDGGDGDDQIYGDGGAEILTGGLGSDKLFGGADADTLIGGLGADTLYGGDGVDGLEGGDGNDMVYGDAGAETLLGGGGDDKLYGGVDNDQLSGSIGNDFEDGGAGADTLLGEAGNDSLLGGTENDSLIGDIGNDTLVGGTGDDLLTGGEGNDRLKGEDGNDQLDSGAGNDMLDGGGGDDLVQAFAGDDKVSGSAGTDTLLGGEGNDQLFGGTENDTLVGDSGNDQLTGDAGDDVLAGGAGVDQLTGGLGADVFVLQPFDGSTATAYDTIKDFVSGTDHIAFGDYHLTDAALIGSAAFSGLAGELRFTASAAGLMAQLDANGDGAADLTVLMAKITTLLASDFL